MLFDVALQLVATILFQTFAAGNSLFGDGTSVVEMNALLESRFATTNSTTLAEWERSLPSESEKNEIRKLLNFIYSQRTFDSLTGAVVNNYASLKGIMDVTILQKIRRKEEMSEIEAALRKMKSGKATGPGELPVDLLHLAFLDMEKAFDRVPRDLVWYVLRKHGIPEELINRVRVPAGTSIGFPISVGVNRGSALSPLLCVVVVDAISRDLQMAAPWTLLFCGVVILACEDKTELERQAKAWCDRLTLFGLKQDVKKTEYLTTDVNEHGSIKIHE
ncbi:unnamed protein product [Heligmosomoides polygyrus]|uniref:Reverse transcriptase domain-containing protein n=1 Tax=Heligmosomoides polygyrus TaxID=6339 RepID=A0A183F424_HELPZ|nr:unnamed protein product [Heligmosomoides polygyrus]